MKYTQVCKHCGSDEVARCQWTNVNNGYVYYDVDSGTSLEWCMHCKAETTIIELEDFKKEKIDEDD